MTATALRDGRSGKLRCSHAVRNCRPSLVEHATITVLDELADDNRYAERHVVDLVQRDGDRLLQEASVFAERDSEGVSCKSKRLLGCSRKTKPTESSPTRASRRWYLVTAEEQTGT